MRHKKANIPGKREELKRVGGKGGAERGIRRSSSHESRPGVEETGEIRAVVRGKTDGGAARGSGSGRDASASELLR